MTTIKGCNFRHNGLTLPCSSIIRRNYHTFIEIIKYTPSDFISRVRNLKFATYLKFATCENTNKINELW